MKYLKRYGFKTFDTVWSEKYDEIKCAQQRLDCIVDLLEHIAKLDQSQLQKIMSQAQDIADYNKKRFFSAEFEQEILDELNSNLSQAFTKLKTENTGTRWMIMYQGRLTLTDQQYTKIESSLTDLDRKKFFSQFTEQQWNKFYLASKKYLKS